MTTESWTQSKIRASEEEVHITEVTSSLLRGRGTIRSSVESAGKVEVGLYFFTDDEMKWREEALCKGIDQSVFFPERGASMLQAYAICRACPVRMDCLQSAVEYGDSLGIRGGFTPEERTKIRLEVSRGKSYQEASGPIDERRHKKLQKAKVKDQMIRQQLKRNSA